MKSSTMVLRNVPKTGESITYRELREKTQIKSGLGDILYKLKQAGRIFYQSDPSSAFVDSMEISLPAKAKGLAEALDSPGFASK